LPGIALAKAIDYELKFREDILARPKDHSISARQYEEGQRWNQNMLERLKALQSIIPLPSTVRKR